jgi:predicted PurR-regulated permease PerM
VSRWLCERTGWPYRRTLLVAVLSLIVLVGGLTWLLASTLVAQVTELTQKLPQLWQQARDGLQQYPWGQYLLERAPQAAESFAQSGAVSRVTGLASGVAYVVEAAIVILIVGIFGAADPDVYKRGLLYLVPPGHRSRISQALDETVGNLRGWLLGQITLMVMVGLTTALSLWLLGVPLALTLGLITGVMEMIPYIGPWIAFVPAALISLQLGAWYLVATAGIYLGLHILEGYLVGPLVQRRAIHLPPALTLVTQVLLGEMFGVLGLFVAAPLTVAVVVFVKNLYVEDALGDSTVNQPEHGEPSDAVGRAVAETAHSRVV